MPSAAVVAGAAGVGEPAEGGLRLEIGGAAPSLPPIVDPPWSIPRLIGEKREEITPEGMREGRLAPPPPMLVLNDRVSPERRAREMLVPIPPTAPLWGEANPGGPSPAMASASSPPTR